MLLRATWEDPRKGDEGVRRTEQSAKALRRCRWLPFVALHIQPRFRQGPELFSTRGICQGSCLMGKNNEVERLLKHECMSAGLDVL